LALHPDVETAITIIVARSADEAARIARGEDLTQLREPTEAETAVIAAEQFFEPGVGEAAEADENAETSEAPEAPAAKKN